MTAQGAVRDRCVVRQVPVGEWHGPSTTTRPWCLSHNLPAGHAAPQEGDVGVDPADRPLPSDGPADGGPPPEVQYAGRIATTRTVTARDRRVRAAVSDLRTSVTERRTEIVERGRVALRRLRAEHAAAAQVGNAETELLLAARCADCGEDVGRAALHETDSLVLTAWTHHQRSLEAGHRVRRVVP